MFRASKNNPGGKNRNKESAKGKEEKKLRYVEKDITLDSGGEKSLGEGTQTFHEDTEETTPTKKTIKKKNGAARDGGGESKTRNKEWSVTPSKENKKV